MRMNRAIELTPNGPQTRKGRALSLRLLLSFILLLCGQYSFAHAQSSVTAASRNYDIPADRLDRALTSFARTSNVDIIYDNALANDRRSKTVSGKYSPALALGIMLSGTGLSWRFTKARAVVIYEASSNNMGEANSSSRYPTLMLDTLRVRASPMIGTPSRAPFFAYGRWLQGELYRRILENKNSKMRAFHCEIQLWIDDDGITHRIKLPKGCGNPEVERLIVELISGAQFERKPPPGLPQPLRFAVEGRK